MLMFTKKNNVLTSWFSSLSIKSPEDNVYLDGRSYGAVFQASKNITGGCRDELNPKAVSCCGEY